MAFSKKDWRRIVVGNQVYYWQSDDSHYRGTRSFDPFNILCARPEVESYRLLTVTRGQCGHQIFGFDWRVTPGIVRGCIESAITSGWLGLRPELRSVLFNNLRHVAQEPSWLTATVRSLAEGIYAGSSFDQLPILADALQDAGCDCADLLTHLRSDGPHARGCWALDLVLDK